MIEPRELIKLWVNALRSGSYTQGQGTLQSKEGHCCLGVLARIAPPQCKLTLNAFSEPFMINGHDPMSLLAVLYSGEECRRILPDRFWNKTFQEILGNQERYSEMNDEGHTFSEIADEIENAVKFYDEHNYNINQRDDLD